MQVRQMGFNKKPTLTHVQQNIVNLGF